MTDAPNVGDTIFIPVLGMLGGGQHCVISAVYDDEDDAYDDGYVVETNYPDDGDGYFSGWRVLATDVPFGHIKDYAVVLA